MKWLPFITHRWTATWQAGEAPEEHVAHISLTQTLLLFGKVLPLTTVPVTISQIGPGIVYLTIQSPLGKFYVCEHVTPMQPLFQKVHHAVSLQTRARHPLTSFISTVQADSYSALWHRFC